MQLLHQSRLLRSSLDEVEHEMQVLHLSALKPLGIVQDETVVLICGKLVVYVVHSWLGFLDRLQVKPLRERMGKGAGGYKP